MIWSTFRWIAQTAWIAAKAMPASAAVTRPIDPREPPRPRSRPDRAPDPEERAGQQHPLERDVDHAAPLAVEAADRGERQRRRVAERRGEQRAPDDDGVEVRSRRARREYAEADPEQPRGDRAATDTASIARPGPDARRDGEDAERDRQRGRARCERRQRQPERERAERDAGDADRARVAQRMPPTRAVSAVMPRFLRAQPDARPRPGSGRRRGSRAPG